jgi:hypothetical protein
MGLSKENNVAMMFSKVSKIRYQQINRKAWDKASDTIVLAQSVAYTNTIGKTFQGNHSP